MSKCNLCPRNCGVSRALGEKGVCGELDEIRVARASLHMWEEPPITGKHGSGTVFFSGCPLHCVFCQNYNISNGANGEVVTPDELCSIFLHLQEKGAENINLVTATQFIPLVRSALIKAKGAGLSIPVVYNTSGYETVESLKLLRGIVDIYLPDLKYVSSTLSKKYSHAEDYFEVASKAISEMVNQVGPENVIVRHLVLPGQVEDSKAVLKYLYDTYKDSIYISIMSQFTPLSELLTSYPELNRKLTKEEYDDVVDYAVELGIEHAFVQEGEAAKESFIPDFENWTLKEFLMS